VRSIDGTPLSHVVLDIWHANGEGRYSNIHPELPPFALRARVTTLRHSVGGSRRPLL